MVSPFEEKLKRRVALFEKLMAAYFLWRSAFVVSRERAWSMRRKSLGEIDPEESITKIASYCAYE